MTLGRAPSHEDLFKSPRELCSEVPASSIYRLLADDGGKLFPDEAFADLFRDIGRRSVPPRIVATVMVMQRLDGLSDREAVERFTYDVRWKYACGVNLDFPSFQHTVLVDMRARLRDSAKPNRVFETVLDVASKAGLVGRKRVLDSTALYDAVATQDTVTMIRSAIRGLLRVSDPALGQELRASLRRDDDYASAGKPACDWDDAAAREKLVDALASDGFAALAVVDGKQLEEKVAEAAQLLATVLGQDLELTEDSLFRIARKVEKDRVISTVDPEARHGHKTAARGFDGYKGHIAIDPDSEIITATAVTAGNVGDATAAEALLADVFASAENAKSTEEKIEVYGDASYGTAPLVEKLQGAGIEPNMKVQAPSARGDFFSQEAFEIDTKAGTVTCPNGVLVRLRVHRDGSGQAPFGASCTDCPLRAKCTDSKSGRVVNVHPKHDVLHAERQRQKSAAWKKRYRATRPKVERKFGHLMRRKHGGRRSRMRGRERVGHDFALLAAAANLQRLAKLRVGVVSAE
jgi:hypothetical protein